MSLYGTEWRERGYGLCGAVCPDPVGSKTVNKFRTFLRQVKVEPDLGLSKGPIRLLKFLAPLQ